MPGGNWDTTSELARRIDAVGERYPVVSNPALADCSSIISLGPPPWGRRARPFGDVEFHP